MGVYGKFRFYEVGVESSEVVHSLPDEHLNQGTHPVTKTC